MVAKLLKNGKKIIYQEQKTILSGAMVVGALLLLSAILGMIKVRLYAGVLGAGETYDIVVTAFKLPDLIFLLVVVGSLNAAFIPLFSEYIANKGSEKAWGFASSVFNWALIAFTGFGVVLFIFARPLSFIVAAGFDDSQRDLLVELMRILLISTTFLGISSYISGTLQSFKRFFIPYLSPLLYNLGAIFGILVLYQVMGPTGIAWGVVVGSLLHLLIQVPLLIHLGFKYRFTLSTGPDMKQMITLSLPRTIGLVVDQVKTLVMVNFASVLAVGSISILSYAESIYTVPITVIGAAIAQASLPTFSEQAAKKNYGHLTQTFMASLHQIIFLTTPVMVILIVLKIPVVRLVLGIGRFDWEATVLTSWVLAIFSIGLIGQSANSLILRAFFSMKETKLPVFISSLGVVASILFSASLMQVWGVRGLATGVTIGTLIEFSLLLWLLNQRLHFDKKKLFSPIINILISGAVMAAMIFIPVRVLDQVFIDTTRVVNLVILVWLVLTVGGTTYIGLTWILGVEEVRLFFKILWKLRDFKEAISSAKSLAPQQPTLLED
ncbi:murein biosynthesis integral membrane protein MurJ [candidate division WWE3 bacterium]|uniref:Probable lipid II flippase MurJ n=1 Tax=candidate division WWE3 bacterium TaxID=2053526 RepID=A0A955RPP2_UNCKA|nr:murein biosynthesis integral membrane protein MurJ [candidate division WWE3 bacterium]